MKQLIQWTEQIQNSGPNSWIGPLLGISIILLIRFGLHFLFQKKSPHKRARLFLNTIANWVTLFVLFVYFFTYFSKKSFLYQTLFVFGDTNITLILIVTILFSVILAVKFSKAIREYILPIFYDKYEVDRGLRASINTFLNYFIISITTLVSLSSIGFNLNSLTVFTSVLGVGLGFGLKNVMANFISGLIILFARPIRVGDSVVIDDSITYVEEIKIRATVVRTRANERMIIPNSYFLEEKIVNRSYTNTRLRIPVAIEVAYDSDVELVKETLYASVYELKKESWPNILDHPQPYIFFDKFGDSGLQFSVWFWIETPTDESEFKIPSDLRFKILKKFAEHQISMPFPQREIRILPPTKE